MGEDYVILHHANVFIIEDNILCHLGGPSDHTGSHGNWLNGCKIDLITYPNPCNGYSFPLVFPHYTPGIYEVYRGYIVFGFSVKMFVCVCVCVNFFSVKDFSGTT